MDINIFDDKPNNSATVRIIADSPVMEELFASVLSPIFKRVDRGGSLTVICCEEPPTVRGSECVYVGCRPDSPEGEYHFLDRPLDIEEFYRLCLEIKAGISTSVGSWSYDPARLCASFGKSEISLTPREGELFALLLSEPGQCVSREKMESVLWKGRSDSNCADVYICYLRKKLEKIAGPGVLISIRGQGYMLKNT